jgi:membrane protein DedA with SNARE-associated domain
MLFELIIAFILKVIGMLGYFGIFILTAMESMVLPMPTEILMPLVGYLVLQGQFRLFLALILSILGALFGSLLSYIVARYLGRAFVFRYGKYLLLEPDKVRWAEKWFHEKGDATVFIGRLIPIVKHVISLPAGFGKMDPVKFSFYTMLGAGLLNLALLILGMWLGKNWNIIHSYTVYLDVVVLGFIFFAIGWYIVRRNRKD